LTLPIWLNRHRRQCQGQMLVINGDRGQRYMSDDATADVGNCGNCDCVRPSQGVHQRCLFGTTERQHEQLRRQPKCRRLSLFGLRVSDARAGTPPNENKMSDGHRERAWTAVKAYLSRKT
jgi:hypothetical protein